MKDSDFLSRYQPLIQNSFRDQTVPRALGVKLAALGPHGGLSINGAGSAIRGKTSKSQETGLVLGVLLFQVFGHVMQKTQTHVNASQIDLGPPLRLTLSGLLERKQFGGRKRSLWPLQIQLSDVMERT